MVRNLYILNGLRHLPTRTCLKITGPGESSLIRIEMNTRRGDVISNPRQATPTSNARFIIFGSPTQGFSQSRSPVRRPLPSSWSTTVMKVPAETICSPQEGHPADNHTCHDSKDEGEEE